jgi:hypothetical protein
VFLSDDIDVVMLDPVVSGVAVFFQDCEAYSWVTNINVPRLLQELHAALEQGVFEYVGVTDGSRHWYRRRS